MAAWNYRPIAGQQSLAKRDFSEILDGGMKARILVVDDEPNVLQLVEYNLKAAGYDVETAGDGFEAVKKARVLLPNLIILDLMLPELDGLEVCKLLRRDSKTASIPTILLTAKAEAMDRILGLEFGPDDFVTKPFSPRELLLRVKRLLRHVQTSKERPKPAR